MLNLFKKFKKEYQTLNKIELSKEHLLANYKYLSSLNEQSSRASRTRKVKIAPVIKSNGYGHGIIEIAKILDPLNSPFFCVDSLYEAYKLLKIKIKTPILIMGYTDPQNFKVKKLPFSYALFDLETAQVLNKYQSNCSIHIFVDTGMNREGVPINELPEFLAKIKGFTNLKIEGLMSHFASADDIKDPLNKIQIENFKKALEICKTYNIKPKWIHLQNSDGLTCNLGDCNVNMARIGLALYGISTDPKLKPVLNLKTKIIQIKKINKEDKIGYNGTLAARKPMTLGVLPIGYFDGVDRRLSNKGWVMVDNKPCKIAGRISMNITSIDLTAISSPYIGQEVIVYSNNPKDKNSIENCAKICNTITYDLLVNLNSSIRRIIT